ncbi:MAG: HNH endonuclease, partial [Gemmatimonadetes bacterium]|nr:HNH endonuclease [Gemmatimonadota bacterium]
TVGTAPYIAGGPDVSAETSRRLGCDAGVVQMTHDPDGRTLDVGRRRRTVPTPLRRALERRDRRCRFPGCRSRFCDAHHVRHWADGGETRLDNLVLLCRHHHRRVHEDGWRVTLGPDGDATFHRPDGRVLPSVPRRPAVSPASVAALEREHDRIGVAIDPWTATPDWTGDRMDVDWALFALKEMPRRLHPPVAVFEE